jgi:8-oxo-dGTP pyrophosphatase MutT (NUDIX family)
MTLRRAATVCLVRAGGARIEVLMVQRSPESRFMGGAWVFPGGAVDAGDENRESAIVSSDPDLTPWRAAGARELVEEIGVWLTTDGVRVEPLPDSSVSVEHDAVYAAAESAGRTFDGDGMVFFAHWITPAPLPVRFDTRFFAYGVAEPIEPVIDEHELVDARWIACTDAIELDDAGEWLIAFPTRRTLELFAGYGSPDTLLADVPAPVSIPAIQPRLAVDEGSVEILLPGEDRFDAAGESESDPELLARMITVARSGGRVPPELRRA